MISVHTGPYVRSTSRTRTLFFHLNSFKGVEEEMKALRGLIKTLGPLDSSDERRVSFSADGRAETERAVHRLVVLGVVADYTVDYSARKFEIRLGAPSKEEVLERFYRYLLGYQRLRAAAALKRAKSWPAMSFNSLVERLAQELVEFVYDVVEKGRRRAFSEMLRLCRSGDGDSVRAGILEYLGRSQFADAISELLDADDAGLPNVVSIIDQIRSALDAAEVRGQCGRELEAYPDHPSLLLLRSVAECLTSVPEPQAVFENARAAASNAEIEYDVAAEMVWSSVAACAELLVDHRPDAAQILLAGTIRGSVSPPAAARFFARRLDGPLRRPALTAILHDLASECRSTAEMDTARSSVATLERRSQPAPCANALPGIPSEQAWRT